MRYCVSTGSFSWQTTALSQFAASQKLTQLWMELRQDMSDEFLACQQPFNTLPKLPTDAEQDLRPNLHLAVFHRGERVLLIPISVKPLFPAGDSHGEQRSDV
jgi:hypothetical protein